MIVVNIELNVNFAVKLCNFEFGTPSANKGRLRLAICANRDLPSNMALDSSAPNVFQQLNIDGSELSPELNAARQALGAYDITDPATGKRSFDWLRLVLFSNDWQQSNLYCSEPGKFVTIKPIPCGTEIVLIANMFSNFLVSALAVQPPSQVASLPSPDSLRAPLSQNVPPPSSYTVSSSPISSSSTHSHNSPISVTSSSPTLSGKRSKSLLTCSMCPKTFDRPSLLRRHERTHTGERPYECDVCHKRFSTSSSLNTHKRIHTGEKPHACNTCGKCFTASSNLYYHRLTHCKNKPYQCKACHKSFTTPGDLKNHAYAHSGNWPYQCDICRRGFSKLSNLTQHLALHNGPKPFQCGVCDKAYSQRSNLNAHIKTHESRTVPQTKSPADTPHMKTESSPPKVELPPRGIPLAEYPPRADLSFGLDRLLQPQPVRQTPVAPDQLNLYLRQYLLYASQLGMPLSYPSFPAYPPLPSLLAAMRSFGHTQP